MDAVFVLGEDNDVYKLIAEDGEEVAIEEPIEEPIIEEGD